MQSVIQEKLYDSVRIFWLNKQLVRNRLKEAIRSLVRVRPDIEKIVLFGSFAEGRAAVGSDIDLLIIVKECGKRFMDRALEYQEFFSDIGLGVDIFVFTKEELKQDVKIARSAMEHGRILYERRSGNSSEQSS